MCYEINSILSKFGYFLRMFEIKNKFRHLTTKDKAKNCTSIIKLKNTAVLQ